MNIDIQASDFPKLWVDYVNNKSLEEIVALYHESCTLLPTFSPNNVHDSAGVTAYFSNLASREQFATRLDDDTVDTLHIAEQCYAISGNYVFEFKADGSLLSFPSRFTFVINLALDSPILHHHSSQTPGLLT